jgi:hypothetical protein
VTRGLVGELEVVPEVVRQAGGAREDRQRETRDDLARAQRDDEKRVNQGHRRAGYRRHADRRSERETRAHVQPLHGPEPHDGTDEHHALDPEVEHAGALREQLAERCVEQRRPVGDPGGENDDDERVVHAAASGAGGAALSLTRLPTRTR